MMTRTRRIALVSATVAAALVAAAPAWAQRASLADRVALLEQRAADNQANVQLLNQVNLLKTEVTALRSQVEELQHTLDQLRQTSRSQYLDLDQDTLRPEFQAIVGCHAKYLRDRPSSRMTLEGHADERGSREYNMGLAERRGNSASSAIQANGGSGSQIMVTSYGEERPTCTASSEDCWAKNRRVEIIYTAQ